MLKSKIWSSSLIILCLVASFLAGQRLERHWGKERERIKLRQSIDELAELVKLLPQPSQGGNMIMNNTTVRGGSDSGDVKYKFSDSEPTN